jgi:hypothetical protein
MGDSEDDPTTCEKRGLVDDGPEGDAFNLFNTRTIVNIHTQCPLSISEWGSMKENHLDNPLILLLQENGKTLLHFQQGQHRLSRLQFRCRAFHGKNPWVRSSDTFAGLRRRSL